MVKLPDVANVLRIDLKWKIGEDLLSTTRIFESYTGSAPSGSQLQAWATGPIQTFVGLDLVGLFAPTTSYIGSTVTDLTSTTSGQGSDGSTHAGTRTGATLPASASALINLTINRRYRGGKPRWYFPFGTSTDLADAQTWTPAFITAVTQGLNAFFGGINGQPPGTATITNIVNVSYYFGVNVPVTLPSGRVKQSAKVRDSTTPDVVTGRTVNVKVGSQRRRINA